MADVNVETLGVSTRPYKVISGDSSRRSATIVVTGNVASSTSVVAGSGAEATMMNSKSAVAAIMPTSTVLLVVSDMLRSTSGSLMRFYTPLAGSVFVPAMIGDPVSHLRESWMMTDKNAGMTISTSMVP